MHIRSRLFMQVAKRKYTWACVTDFNSCSAHTLNPTTHRTIDLGIYLLPALEYCTARHFCRLIGSPGKNIRGWRFPIPYTRRLDRRRLIPTSRYLPYTHFDTSPHASACGTIRNCECRYSFRIYQPLRRDFGTLPMAPSTKSFLSGLYWRLSRFWFQPHAFHFRL